VTPEDMGWMFTSKFIAKGARSKGRNAYFRKFVPPTKQWGMMRDLLNRLVKEQRLELTLPKAKELVRLLSWKPSLELCAQGQAA